uniref:Uncharacterized protein n=1 Tax=Amphimedon queenslandica TaxID=400682 RepID=A0A1X7ULR3_AMPQE
MEIGQLVDMIVASQKGQKHLSEVFSEADGVAKGAGNVLKEVWEKYNSEWNQFKIDQKENKTGKSSNKWSSVTIQMAIAI